MMRKDDCFELGHVTKLHGFKGEVKFFLDTDSPQEYSKLESILLEVSGNLTPFFVKKIRVLKNVATIQFDGVDNEEKAKMLIKAKGFLPLSMLPKLGKRHFYHHEVIGFNCIDRNEGNIGTIKDVYDLSANVLLQVIRDQQEILLPTNNEVDIEVDRSNKTLTLTCPPGLLDMYFDA